MSTIEEDLKTNNVQMLIDKDIDVKDLYYFITSELSFNKIIELIKMLESDLIFNKNKYNM